MKVALDTNVLIYAEGVGGAEKAELSRQLMGGLADRISLPAQALAEFYSVLTQKAGVSREEARGLMTELAELFPVLPSDSAVLRVAAELAERHGLRIFDSIMVAAAAEAGCALLLSEDMQDGFVYRGVTIANPFAERPHPLLASLLELMSHPPLAGAPE